ncbi:MAG: Na(+)/H(+) antiporter subunit D [Nitrospirota bacterium]
MIEWIHPGLLLIVGAAFIPLFRGSLKKIYMLALPTAALIACIFTTPGTHGVVKFLGYDLILGRVDKLSLLFSYVFSIMGIIGVVYALHVKDDAQHVSSLVYVGSALGVTFAGDFFSLFVFWEIMAFAPTVLVWSNKSKESIDAGFRYLLVHIFGGICLMGGAMLHLAETGSIEFSSMMAYEGGLAFYLVLLGFLINAAVPPFGAWLPDAYPEATVTGAVFMTAFTTKSAVYVLIRGFAGTELLIWMGAIMALYGVVYAVLENDARRLLAYHIISQVGYMVCGVGIGTEMALNGASSHAFAHILYKGLLFMGAGAVLEMTGKRKLTEMGGLYKTMPVTMVLYMIGGFAISGVPLFSGFVSKSMVVSAAGENHMAIPFLMLTLASAGTFLHTGLKLPYYMFFGKDSGIRTKEPPTNMLIAMGMAAFVCIFFGVFPGVLYNYLPFETDYAPYTIGHTVSTLGMLGFTALGFFMLLKMLDPEATASLDTDWFYRKGAKAFMWLVNNPVVTLEYNVVGEAYEFIIQKPILKLAQIFRSVDAAFIDGSANGLGKVTMAWSRVMQVLQTGQTQIYATVMALGIFVTVALILLLEG